jgi:hypothetical protein
VFLVPYTSNPPAQNPQVIRVDGVFGTHRAGGRYIKPTMPRHKVCNARSALEDIGTTRSIETAQHFNSRERAPLQSAL